MRCTAANIIQRPKCIRAPKIDRICDGIAVVAIIANFIIMGCILRNKRIKVNSLVPWANRRQIMVIILHTFSRIKTAKTVSGRWCWRTNDVWHIFAVNSIYIGVYNFTIVLTLFKIKVQECSNRIPLCINCGISRKIIRFNQQFALTIDNLCSATACTGPIAVKNHSIGFGTWLTDARPPINGRRKYRCRNRISRFAITIKINILLFINNRYYI